MTTKIRPPVDLTWRWYLCRHEHETENPCFDATYILYLVVDHPRKIHGRWCNPPLRTGLGGYEFDGDEEDGLANAMGIELEPGECCELRLTPA